MATQRLEEARRWLNENEEAIVENLDPKKAVQQLMRACLEDFSERDKDDVLLNYRTPRERTEKLVDILRTRALEALEAFREIIITQQPQLAEILQPVRYQVTWLCPSAKHAAMAVHLLESYSETRFLAAEDGGTEFLVRRSSGAFGQSDTQVKLVFPVRPELFSHMLAETVMSRECAQLVVLTGACETLKSGIPPGQAVIPLSSSGGRSSVRCPTAHWARDHRGELTGRLKGASWMTELSCLYRDNAYLDYCAAWLGRLYVELVAVEKGQRSSWLEQLGWREGGVEGNSALMSHLLPDWDTGHLARHVLRERGTWRCDPSSPLGLAPTQPLLARLLQRKSDFNGFPSLIGQRAPHGPTFHSLSASGDGGGDVTDTPTHQFYRACSDHLTPDTDWLACLTVSHDAASDSHQLTACTAVTMAMEVALMRLSTYNREES